MINRIDTYKNHIVHVKLAETQRKLEELSKEFLSNITYGEIINRCQFIISAIIESLANGQNELVRLSWCDTINDMCDNIGNEIINFHNNNNMAHIDNIDMWSDELLEYLFRLNAVNNMPLDVNEAYSKYVESYQNRVTGLISCIDETESKLNAIKEDVDNSKKTSDSRLEELSNRINNEQQRLDSFAISYQQQMDEDRGNYSRLKEDFKQQFANSVKAWDDKITDLTIKGNQEQDNFIYSYNGKIVEFNKEKDDVIQNYRADFDHYKSEVEKLVGIISANTWASKYREVADDARKRSSKWHRLAIGSLAGFVLFAVFAFVITTNSDTSIVKLIAKIITSASIASVAGYAITQANKQEKVERYARKIEME